MTLSRRQTLGLAGAALLLAPRAALAGKAKHPIRDGAELIERMRHSGESGFCLLDLETGAVIEAHQPARAFPPASVAKVPTALYALDALGADAAFETRLIASGPIENGVLKGDLTLVGGGDPELDSGDLAGLATSCAARIKRVEGRFLVEAGLVAPQIFPDMPVEAAYNPAVARLALNFNRVKLAWTRKGEQIDAQMRAWGVGAAPMIERIGLTLSQERAGPVYAYETRGEAEHWTVRASAMQGNASVMLPVHDPASYAGEAFQRLAAGAGLTLPPPQMGAASQGAVVAARLSRPLRAILAEMLRYSTNLTAEMTGLAATRARGWPGVALAESGGVMSRWATEFAGLEATPAFVNHSGLTTQSRVSPHAMAALLRAGDAARPGGVALRDILEDRASPVEGAVIRAKTGTLDFTRGLAGYLNAPSGRRMAFAIFSEDLERRAADDVGAKRWRNRAVELERLLLESWAQRF